MADAPYTDDDHQAAAEPHPATPAGLAYRALLEHTQMCEQCVHDSRECPTGRALVRTLRKARQSC